MPPAEIEGATLRRSPGGGRSRGRGRILRAWRGAGRLPRQLPTRGRGRGPAALPRRALVVQRRPVVVQIDALPSRDGKPTREACSGMVPDPRGGRESRRHAHVPLADMRVVDLSQQLPVPAHPHARGPRCARHEGRAALGDAACWIDPEMFAGSTTARLASGSTSRPSRTAAGWTTAARGGGLRRGLPAGRHRATGLRLRDPSRLAPRRSIRSISGSGQSGPDAARPTDDPSLAGSRR